MSFAGHLDKTVNIDAYTKGASDGMGGYAAGTWAAIYKKVRAALVVIAVGEQILSYDKKNVFAEVYWYLEPLSGIKEGQRIRWGARTWEIKLALSWQEKGRFMKLACAEIARQI